MPKDKNHSCSHCEYTSKKKGNVTKHMKAVHEKKKDFKCSLCEYATATRQSLSRHTKLVHEKIKEFTCAVCEKKFGCRGNLKKHIQICINWRTIHMKQSKTSQCLEIPKRASKTKVPILRILSHRRTVHLAAGP